MKVQRLHLKRSFNIAEPHDPNHSFRKRPNHIESFRAVCAVLSGAKSATKATGDLGKDLIAAQKDSPGASVFNGRYNPSKGKVQRGAKEKRRDKGDSLDEVSVGDWERTNLLIRHHTLQAQH